MMDCIFCRIVKGVAPAEIIYEDEIAMAFMDANPATPGHILIVPKQHYRNIFDLNDEVAAHLMKVAVRLASVLRKAMGCDGLNIFNANERAAFQNVFHFHLHLIPRWFDDNIVPAWHPQPGDPAQIKKIADKIRHTLANEMFIR